jgi:hypothetical protein
LGVREEELEVSLHFTHYSSLKTDKEIFDMLDKTEKEAEPSVCA